MQKYNKSGCLSGGYLLDTMDNFAHNKITKQYPPEDGKFWFTSKHSGNFVRQSCRDWKLVKCDLDLDTKRDGKIEAFVRLFDDEGSTICYADIVFVKGTIQCGGLENEKGKQN